MAVELATAYVSIVPSAKGIGKQIGDEIEGGVAGASSRAGGVLSSTFGKVATAAGGLFAAKVGTDFFRSAIDGASDLNESVSKVGVVFGDQAPKIEAFAKGAAQAIGQSRQQALEAAGTFGNLFVSMGITGEGAANMSTSLVTLGSDLASFNNVSVDDALLALRSGLVGETEPLRRFGVNINQAALEAKALEIGLVKTSGSVTKIAQAQLSAERAQNAYNAAVKKFGEGSVEAQDKAAALEIANSRLAEATSGTIPPLDAAQKAQAAYALVMDQTKTAQGDFSRTSDGLANQQRILGARFTDLKANIGKALLPVMLRITGFLNERLIPAFSKIGQALAPVVKTVAGAMRQIGAILFQRDFVGGGPFAEDSPFIEGVFRFRDIIVRDVLPVVRKVVEFLQRNWRPVLIAAGAAFVALTAPVTGVVAALALAYVRFDAFRDVLQTVGRAVTRFGRDFANTIGDAVTYVQEIWPQVSEAIGHVLNVVSGIVRTFIDVVSALWRAWGDDLLRIVERIFGFIRRTVENALRTVQGVIQVVLAVINGDWGKAWDGLTRIVGSTFDQIRNIVGTFVGTLRNLFGGVASTIAEVTRGIWDPVKAGAERALGGLAGFVRAVFQEVLDIIFPAVNLVIQAINALIRAYNALPFAKDIDTIKHLETPDLTPAAGSPTNEYLIKQGRAFQHGGVVPGQKGSPQVILAHGGELVVPERYLRAARLPHQSGDAPLIGSLTMQTSDRADDAVRALTDRLRTTRVLLGMA